MDLTRNTESDEPELEKIGDKSQDKNWSILINSLSDARWNQIIGVSE